MAVTKEKTNQGLEIDLRFFLATQLATLFQLIGEDEIATTDKQEIFEDVRSDVLKFVEEEHPEEITQAEQLLAVAIVNLDKIKTAPERQKLIAEFFPTKEEQIISRLRIVQAKYSIGEKTITTLLNSVTQAKKLHPNRILKSLEIIVNKLQRNPNSEYFGWVLDYVVFIWPELTVEYRLQFEKFFTKLSISLSKSDPIGTAELFIHWQDELFQIGRESDSNKPELGLLHTLSTDGPRYSETLMQLLPVQAFDSLGYALKNGARDEALTTFQLLEKYSNILATLRGYPSIVVERMVDVYCEAGFVRRYKNGKFILTSKGRKSVDLGSSELHTVRMATNFLSQKRGTGESLGTMEQIVTTYENHQKEIGIPEKKIVIEGSNRRVLYIGDILFGQKDLSMETVTDLLTWIRLLPPENKPHQVIISGIVAGAFQYRQKDRRAALAIPSMDKQFNAAKIFIDALIEQGLEISYILSSEDLEQARNYTLMAMRALQNWANPQQDFQKGHITYWQEDQIKQIDAYDIHYDFQVNVAYPYYLRSGRRLRSADEVHKLKIVRDEYRNLRPEELRKTPGVYVRQEEYILLFDAYQRLINNEPLPLHYYDILEIENIPIPGKEFPNFGIYNGLKFVAETDQATFTSLLHHNGLQFSDKGIHKVPINDILTQIGEIAASGSPLPDEFVTFHQKEGMGFGGVVSLPGFDTVNVFQRTQSLAVSGETALRQVKRGTGVPNPGAIMRTLYNDRTVTTLLTREQMDLADSHTDRIAWAFPSDHHVGSQAAWLDGLVRYYDYVLKEVLPQYKTVMSWMGDQIQARNVLTMPEESAIVGLQNLPHQEQFWYWILKESLTQGQSFDDLPPFLKNIVMAYLMTGNHERNTAPREITQSFTGLQETLLVNLLGEERVEYFQTMTSNNGEHLVYPGGITKNHGGLTAYLAHKLFWGRFGNKNSIIDAQKIVKGLGDEFSKVNLMVMGDKHISMWGFAAGKLVLVVPSTCFGTGYELGLGLRSKPGATILYSGAGKPLEIHELSQQLIANHIIKSGPFSDEYMADFDPRLVTDPDYRPHHGLYSGHYSPHNALQKRILMETERVVLGNRSRLG